MTKSEHKANITVQLHAQSVATLVDALAEVMIERDELKAKLAASEDMRSKAAGEHRD